MKLEVEEVQISVDTCFEFGVSLEAGSQELEAGLLRCCDVAELLRTCRGLFARFHQPGSPTRAGFARGGVEERRGL